ncbi:MAG TPA: DUF1501 domain-containing protein [Gemmataceae bacterium]
MTRFPTLTRRDWLRLATAGVLGGSMSGWMEMLAQDAAKNPQRKRACILLWMSGGPSQTDTFDLKPGHANGGPYKEIATSVPGIKISEHLPKLATHMKDMVLVRSMSTKEADHGRATYYLRTGRVPGGPVQYPPLGSFVAKELECPDAELPSFVSISPFRGLNQAAFTPGFLGPQYAPLIVGENANFGGQRGGDISQALRVQDLDLPRDVNAKRSSARLDMLDEMEQEFLAQRSSVAAESHRTAYQRAITMMRSSAVKAFNLNEEPDKLRDTYGRNLFGQGCLLARRLVERGVPFVEVSLNGWDTHNQNFEQVKRLSGTLDPAWATLMDDLKDKGLLYSTLVVWMGEFGRTPKVNGQKGRDHWANSWTTVLAGGGVKGGQVVGKTSADGMTVEERKVEVPDLLGTVCLALGLDPRKQNDSNVGRPIRLVEPTAKPIKEVVA